MNDVHVTALSFESPLGNDFVNLAENLRKGASGIRHLTREEVSDDFPIRYAAKIKNGTRPLLSNDLEMQSGPHLSPFSKMAQNLAKNIAPQISEGLKVDGLICSYRELNSFSVAFDLFKNKNFPPCGFEFLDRDKPLQSIQETLAREKNIEINLKNLIVMSSACVSGASALGIAFQRIRSGEWSRALVSAIELDPNPLQMMSLYLLGALSLGFKNPEEASRPFSKSRNGFVKGEAAGLILLESSAAMTARGGRSYGQILGYSTTADAWRLTEGRPDGRELVAAMNLAMADARVSAGQIGYIKAHATSTLTGDQIEAEAIKTVFGPLAHVIPISSLKSQLGHSTQAAGLMEFICTLALLKNQFVAGNLNLTDMDPKIASLELDFVGPVARPHSFTHALLNSSGFGGQNACLVVKAPPTADR